MSVPLKNTPPTLPSPSEPITPHNEPLTMIHDQQQQQRPHKLTKPRPIPPPVSPLPALPFISENNLAVHPTSHQRRHHHAKSDCGHDSSPQLKRSRSLLRNFSLRSRNSFTLRKSKRQHLEPSSSAASSSQNVGNHLAFSASQSYSTNYSNGSSDIHSSLSMWKRWRISDTRSRNSSGVEDKELHHDAMSSPMTQTPARKRSLRFLPFISVGRFAAPSYTSFSSQENSSRVVTEPPSAHQLRPLQGQDNNKNHGNGNAFRHEHADDGLLPRIYPTTNWDLDVELFNGDVPDVLTSEPPLNSPPPIISWPLPTSSIRCAETDGLGTDWDRDLPSLVIGQSEDVDAGVGSSRQQDAEHKTNEDLSSTTNDLLGLEPVSVTTTTTTIDTPSQSNHQLSSNPNPTPGLNLNLKPSISQKRRAKFTLDDESDLDSQTTTAVVAPPPTRHEISETRDQNGTTINTGSTANFKSTRRWTLSSALTDEGISDEGLAKELERMRESLEWDCKPPTDMDEDDPSFLPSFSPPSPNPTWLITQRVLLTTRELILTERHYLSSLLLLLCPDSTLTPVPEMMLSYVKELVGVSERLLKGMEREPSVRGVAEVFVQVGCVDGDESKGAESAFVDWCGVVGGWFQDEVAVSGDTQDGVDVKRKRKRFESSEEHHLLSEQESPGSTPGPGAAEHSHTSPLKRTVSTWRRSMPSIAGLGEGGARRRDKDKDEVDSYGHEQKERMSPTSSISMAPSTKPIRKHAVRDLAILPTQRVMRYVLLYRDLLANTPPTSSTYPIVERAVEAACKIAEKCDRAQSNAAFIAGSSGRHPSSNSTANASSSSISNNGRRFSGKRVTIPEPTANLRLKHVRGGSSTHSTTSSPTSSPTKSYFLLPPLPSHSPSKLSSTSLPPSLSSKLTPLPASPTKVRVVANPLPPPPPPSSFNSKVPIARSHQSFGSGSTYSDSSSTSTVSLSQLASLSSSSASSTLFLPKSTSSSSSSRMPKSLSAVSLMSLVNGLGRSVSGPAGGVDSGLARAYVASPGPTKIEV